MIFWCGGWHSKRQYFEISEFKLHGLECIHKSHPQCWCLAAHPLTPLLVFTHTLPCGLVSTHSPIVCLTITPIFCNLSSVSIIHCSQVSVQNEDLCPISHKFVWIQNSKYHTLLDDLQSIRSSVHTLVVVEDVDVAEQATQLFDKHGILVHNYDQAIAQSFRSGEIPILITTVEEDFYEEFTGTATNVLVVDVPLFITSQYLSYKELLAEPGGHLTFYVDNDNWLSVAYVIKQLLEQGISLTTDPYPPSPKSPSSPDSHPSMAVNSVCLSRLDSFALAQHNVDELKYESARLAQQIQQLSCKLNVPHSHTDMAPELVHADSNHPCTKPQANISRSEFVPQDLDSSATDDISESITLLSSLRVTNDYIPIPLSPFLALEAETHGDLESQQTCHALHAELQNNLTYNEGPLSSDTVVRHDVSSPSPDEVALLDVSMPHHPPVSDGKM